jgi:hypothetical protein
MKEDKTQELWLKTVKHCRGKEGGVGLMKREGACDYLAHKLLLCRMNLVWALRNPLICGREKPLNKAVNWTMKS